MCAVCELQEVDEATKRAMAAHGPIVAVATVYTDGAVDVTSSPDVPQDFIQAAFKMASKARHWHRHPGH